MSGPACQCGEVFGEPCGATLEPATAAVVRFVPVDARIEYLNTDGERGDVLLAVAPDCAALAVQQGDAWADLVTPPGDPAACPECGCSKRVAIAYDWPGRWLAWCETCLDYCTDEGRSGLLAEGKDRAEAIVAWNRLVLERLDEEIDQ